MVKALLYIGTILTLIGATMAIWKIGPGNLISDLPVVGGMSQAETFVESKWVPLGSNYWIDPPETFLLLGGALLIAAHKESGAAAPIGALAIVWALAGIGFGVA